MNNYGYSDESMHRYSLNEDNTIPKLSELQAESFLLDAEEYRSIKHKLDLRSLEIYKFMYSKLWKFVVFFSIVSLHCWAFLEYPSSLTIRSVVNENGTDLHRVVVPSVFLYIFEAIFLCVIFTDGILQSYLFGFERSIRSPWTAVFFIVMVVSWIDFFVNISIGQLYLIRLRRFFRPIFAMQKSQLMKKVLKSLSKTFVDIMSASLLLVLWIIGFSLISVSIFSGFEKTENFNDKYNDFYETFITLLVLLTTANNPDAMIKEYNYNRFTFIFFFIYMAVGIFVFMNLLMGIVFEQFRGHVLDSMQTSLLRRRIACRAMFEILKKTDNIEDNNFGNEVDVTVLDRVIQKSSLSQWRKNQIIQVLMSFGIEVVDWDNFKLILSHIDDPKNIKNVIKIPKFESHIMTACQKFILSKSFEIAGLLICLANVIIIAVDVSTKSKVITTMSKNLDVLNWLFIYLYLVEQVAKCVAMGYKIYFTWKGFIFDFLVTLVILIMKIAELVIFQLSLNRYHYLFGVTSVWDLPRITNLLVMLRAVRIVLLLPSLTPIIHTLFDIPWRMRSVIGVLVMLFYAYSLLGMVLFKDSINPKFMAQNKTDCGSYQQLNYGGINFNDFLSSIVVLWCLLIVNNWHIFMETFAVATNTKWVHLYMITWWIIAVIIVLNCVTAFVIEGYAQRKSFFEQSRKKAIRPQSVSQMFEGSMNYLRRSVVVNDCFTFQMLFKNDLVEPDEETLIKELKKCHYLCEIYPHIVHSQYSY